MTRLLLALPLLMAAACAANQRPYAPVQNVRYQAIGHGPFWMVTIGDDRLVLRKADWPQDVVHPRPLPRTVGGVTTWQAGGGPAAIVIEARPGLCTNSRGQVFEDQVRVRLSGDTLDPLGRYAEDLTGCGGRLVSEGRH